MKITEIIKLSIKSYFSKYMFDLQSGVLIGMLLNNGDKQITHIFINLFEFTLFSFCLWFILSLIIIPRMEEDNGR